MLVDIELPPGLSQNGTVRQSRGRWYNGNLVRWTEGTLRPIGGWLARSASTVTGKARAIWPWIDNGSAKWIGIGTHSHLYVMKRDASLFDITPSGFTSGRADASIAGGYGSGLYGAGLYGTPRLTTGSVLDASVWTLDNFGEDLVGCMADDGKLYLWDTSVGTGTIAAAISGAPTSCRGVIVSEEGFVMALGAGGDPRRVDWSDQRVATTWTPASDNQAGSYNLQTIGRIMCARRTRGAVLIFTDQDVFSATYQGTPYIYGFQRVGEGCGIISQAAVISAGAVVAWMGAAGFWAFDGYSKPLSSAVSDAVFSDFNSVQRSKVFAVHNPDFGEVTWFYCSSASTEINRYVTWNYRENTWALGQLARTCGAERGAFAVPLMVDPSGVVYEHETGNTYGSDEPFAETGPFEWPDDSGIGNRVVSVMGISPDERTAGDVAVTFYGRMYPNGAETTFGPYALTNKNPVGRVDTRFTTREVRMRVTGTGMADWRLGVFQLAVSPRGMR